MSHLRGMPLWGHLNGKVILRLAGALLLCWSAFGGAGAVVLLVTQPSAVAGLTTGLLARAALFTALTGLGAWLVYRGNTHPKGSPKYAHKPPYPLLPLIPALAFAAMLVVPNLTSWPWTAPDETHHLVVARNIAAYGVYGSGHPDTGFIVFDSYDSVGPAVLLPVAAVFKVFGVSLEAARGTMAAFYLFFCVALFYLLRRPYGAAPAAAGVVLATCGFSSIYLGRTLYGEVPGMAYLLAGLVAWRHGILNNRWPWFLVAGACFGLAVLSKTILLLMGFAILAAWWHDRCSWRRIPLQAILLPAVPAGLLLVMWSALTAQHSSTGPGVLELYQHYLLFGLSPVPGNLATLGSQPVAHAVYLAVLFVAGHQLFGRRYDPAMVVFFLLGCFYLYWWTCYTPGQLHRYRWFFYALGGALLGATLVHLSAYWLLQLTRSRERLLVAVVVVTAVAPSVMWLMDQSEAVYENQEMATDKRLARYINDLPDDARIATTSYPLRGTLNFLCNRAIAGGEDVATLLNAYDVVIVSEETPLPEGLPAGVDRVPLPPYIMLSHVEGATGT